MTPHPCDPLLAYRNRFPILDRNNYLISNSLGAVPLAAFDSLRTYAETWATRGVRAWEESWWSMVADLGDLVAPLIGVEEPGSIVFQPNVTLAHAVVLSALDFRGDRPKIVVDETHFPSILYLLGELRSQGAEVCVIPSEDGLTTDLSRIVEAIDDRTAAVCTSHVLFKSAFIQDVESICRKARDVGALSIIDGYQSVGTIPVDVKAIVADVYIGGCLKWLCGGPGTAFLWVRPDIATLTPRLTGWMAHSRPFAFEPGLERRADAWRFLHGTPNIPALYAARPGLEIIAEVGIEAIRAKSRKQTARVVELASNEGYRVNAPLDPERRGGTVAIEVDHGAAVSRALKARDIVCDYRPGAGIRLSPHFYNKDEELDEAIGAIRSIIDREEWKTFENVGATVT